MKIGPWIFILRCKGPFSLLYLQILSVSRLMIFSAQEKVSALVDLQTGPIDAAGVPMPSPVSGPVSGQSWALCHGEFISWMGLLGLHQNMSLVPELSLALSHSWQVTPSLTWALDHPFTQVLWDFTPVSQDIAYDSITPRSHLIPSPGAALLYTPWKRAKKLIISYSYIAVKKIVFCLTVHKIQLKSLLLA